MSPRFLQAVWGAATVGVAGLLAASCLFPSLSDLSACVAGCGGSSAAAGGAEATSSASASTGVGGATSSTSSTTTGVGGAASSSSTSSGGSGGSGGGLPACALTADMHGPKGVLIQPSGGFPSFCVDESEVTIGQYRAFYEGNNFPVPPPLIPAQCGWKSTFQSAFRPMGYGSPPGSDYIWNEYKDLDREDNPVQGIDWCDAAIFCAWSKKRLCGAENKANRHIDTLGDPSWNETGEWRRACGGPKSAQYGYGPTGDATICNDVGGPVPKPHMDPFNVANATDLPQCVATWPTGLVYGMNGNVQEYDDSCDDGTGATPADDICHPRGGSYLQPVQFTSCTYEEYTGKGYTRSKKTEYTGFRCCWDDALSP